MWCHINIICEIQKLEGFLKLIFNVKVNILILSIHNTCIPQTNIINVQQGAIYMNKKNLKIAVSGDVCTNVLTWRTFNKTNKGFKWENSPYVHRMTKEGGALLLAKLVSLACEDTVISPKIADTKCELPKELLQSSSELELFSVTGKENDPKRFIG